MRPIKYFCISICFAASVMTVAGCGGKKPEKPKARPPAPVIAASAVLKDIPVHLKAIGTMEASESVVVRPQVAGEIVQVAFTEGQDVAKGTLLFRLDQRIAQAALNKAEASLKRNRIVSANAEKDYQRYFQLFKDGIVTQEQAEAYRTKAESAAADVAADLAAVESAKAQLSYASIYAPTGGRTGKLAADRGNIVKANETPLVTINRLSPIHAVFAVPEKDLPVLRRQMASGKVTVEAEVPGSSGIREAGIVSFVDNTVDPATGTIKLKAVFENRDRRLWPGQFVNLSIVLEVRKQVVAVPAAALQTGQQGQFVFVINREKNAELRTVATGPTAEGLTAIEKGLLAGEQVVTDGHIRVVPGSPVEIRQPESAKPKAGSPPPASPQPQASPAKQTK